MPNKQLVDLVNRMQKSGIQISFTKPRTKILLHLNGNDRYGTATDMIKYSCHESRIDRSILEYI